MWPRLITTISRDLPSLLYYTTDMYIVGGQRAHSVLVQRVNKGPLVTTVDWEIFVVKNISSVAYNDEN